MITFLPLDLKGNLASNLRQSESHILTRIPNRTNRVCVLDHGAFYVNGLVVRDGTGRLLTHGNTGDYVTTYNYGELSSLTAKEIMAMIVVTNTAVISPITVTYQAVGGAFGISTVELKALMAALVEENFDLKWEDIIGKPTAYVPEDHPHEWWQLWGMQSTVTEIDRIAAAWRQGNKAIVDANEEFANGYLDKAQAALDDYTVMVKAHIADFNNPHQTDKYKVQLGNINNWSLADTVQVLDRADNEHYLPIGGVYRILETGPLGDLRNHITNPNNPHGTTAEMVGTYTIPVVQSAFNTMYLWTDIAVDSLRFNGWTQPKLRTDVTTQLDATDVVSGRFHYSQVGANSAGIGTDYLNWALCGDGRWRKWTEVFAPFNATRYKLISVGRITSIPNTINTLNATYNSAFYSNGSFAFGTLYSAPSATIRYDRMVMFTRVAGVWKEVT